MALQWHVVLNLVVLELAVLALACCGADIIAVMRQACSSDDERKIDARDDSRSETKSVKQDYLYLNLYKCLL